MVLKKLEIIAPEGKRFYIFLISDNRYYYADKYIYIAPELIYLKAMGAYSEIESFYYCGPFKAIEVEKEYDIFSRPLPSIIGGLAGNWSRRPKGES